MKSNRHSKHQRFARRKLAVGMLALTATIAAAMAQEQDSSQRDGRRASRQILIDGPRNIEAPVEPAPAVREGIRSPDYAPASEGALPDESADLAPLPQERQPGAREPAELATPLSTPLPSSRAAAGSSSLIEPQAEQEAGLRPSERGNRPDQDSSADRDAVPEGITRLESIPADDPERYQAVDPEQQRVEAIEALDRQPEEDPYSQLGLRLGTLTLMPSIGQGLRWTSNAYSSPDARSSLLSETNLRLGIRSDWARHSGEVNAYGSFRRSISGAHVSETEGGIDGNLRLDFSEDLRGIVEGSYAVRPESASSPSLIGDVSNRPLTHTLSGALGVEKDVGKMRFSLRGGLERDIYDDAKLADGTTVSQRDRNSTLALATLRAGYEVSPAFIPFVEVEAGRRYYDQEVDGAGYRRSADRLGAKLGTELDFGEKLRGELAAGFLSEDLDDNRLGSISGLAIDANIAWSPVRETTITLAGSTAVEGATSAGNAGSLLHTASISAERRIRANLTGNLRFGGSLRDYAGSSDTDLTLTAEAGLTYWLNRYAGIDTSFRHETLKAADSSRDYNTNSVFLGLTVRR